MHELIEGWPLGVQLAIASLRRNDDLSSFLSAATADIRRFFIDRLIDRQPEAAKQLLIRISSLDLVHPDLCVAILQDEDARGELCRLQEQTPLLSQAEEGEWMRLHPMAREVLNERIQEISEDSRKAMSARASDWLAQAGLFEAAAEQALAAGLEEQAYAMVEIVMQQMLTDGRIGAVLEWHRRLPDAEFDRHPGFWMPVAWALAMSERHAEALPLVDRIVARSGLHVEDRFEAALILMTSAGFSDSADKLSAELETWVEAPKAARPRDIPVYWISRGLASLYAGKPEQARVDWLRFEGFDRTITYTPMSRGFGSYGVAISYLWEGRCALAEQVLRPALAVAEAQMGRRNLVTCMLAALLARARWEMGCSDEPTALLALRLDILERQALPDALMSAYLTLARIAEHEGRHDKSFSMLEELRAIGITRRIPRLHFAAQCEMVRQHAKAGRGETAGALVRQLSMIFATQQAQYPMQFLPWLELQLELAKVYAALAHQGADHMLDALQDVDRATTLATSLNLGREGVEVRMLRSEVLDRCGDAAAAADVRREALSLAEISGQMRLIEQYGGPACASPVRATPSAATAAMDTTIGGAILTIKEREILSLLAQSMSNKEIATALDLSEQTVKWHLKNLFQKLDGANRKHTVARARMLGLIAA